MIRKLFVLLVICVIAATAFSIAAFYSFDLRAGKPVIEQELSSFLQRPVHIGEISLQVIPTIALNLQKISIGECDQRSACLTADTVQVGISLSRLLQRVVSFENLVIEQPYLSITRDIRKRFNVGDLVALFSGEKKVRPEGSRSFVKEFRFRLEEVTILDGKVVFRDYALPGGPTSVSVVHVYLRCGSLSYTDAAPLTFSCMYPGEEQKATLKLQGLLGPLPRQESLFTVPWNGHLAVNNIPLRSMQPYLKGWTESLLGSLDGEGSFSGAPGGDFQISGTLRVRDFAVERSDLFAQTVAAEEIRLDGTCSKGGDQVRIARVAIELPALRLEGKGVVDLKSDYPATIETEIAHVEYATLLECLPIRAMPERLQTILTRTIQAGTVENLSAAYAGNLAELPEVLRRDCWEKVQLSASLREVSFATVDDMPPVKHLQAEASLNDGTFGIAGIRARFGNSLLENGELTVSPAGELKLQFDCGLDLSDVNTIIHASSMPANSRHTVQKLKHFDGRGHLKMTASGPVDSPSRLRYSGTLAFTNATLDYLDFRKRGTNLAGQVSFDPTVITVHRTTGLWDQSPFVCTGTITNYRSKPDSRIQIHVASEQARLQDLSSAFFSWLVNEAENTILVDIDFFCNGYRKEGFFFSGRTRFDNLAISMPAFPYPFTSLTGAIDFSSHGLAFRSVKGTTGTSTVFYTGEWRNFKQPVMTGRIEGQVVNFTDFLKPPEEEPAERRSSHRLDDVEIVVHEGRYKDLLFSDLKASVNYYDGLVEVTSLQAESASYKGIAGEQLSNRVDDRLQTILYSRGVAYAPSLTLNMYGGVWYGSDIRIPFRNAGQSQFSLTSAIRDFSVADVIAILPPEKRTLTGTLDLDGTISGSSNSLNDLLNTMEGSLAFSIRDGTLRKAIVLSKIFSLLNVSRIFSQDYTNLLESGIPYNRITGSFELSNGVARTESIFLDSAAMKMNALGTIDLSERFVDMEIAVEPLETVDKVLDKIPIVGTVLMGKEGAFVVSYYKLEGPLNDPKLDSIVFQSLGRKGQGIVRRIFQIPENILSPPGKLIMETLSGKDETEASEPIEEP
ncbi:MAG TPA: AsmA-like C-terminal domain-containing protein [Thermodesulfobacteriota bacterium]|nr:AsmA-like C-terminal domain-containing protein [Thermodesulfobacteriota bacterium]